MSQYETATATAGAYGASHGGTPVVTFENVSKHYGRLHAVDGLTLLYRMGGEKFTRPDLMSASSYTRRRTVSFAFAGRKC